MPRLEPEREYDPWRARSIGKPPKAPKGGMFDGSPDYISDAVRVEAKASVTKHKKSRFKLTGKTRR